MKAGAILGIIGGVLALLVGAVGYSASTTLGNLSAGVGYAEGASSMQFYRLMSIVLPIVGLVGGGMAFKNPKVGAGLMAVSTVGILFSFGVGIFSLLCAGLLGVGALLVFLDAQKGPYERT